MNFILLLKKVATQINQQKQTTGSSRWSLWVLRLTLVLAVSENLNSAQTVKAHLLLQ